MRVVGSADFESRSNHKTETSCMALPRSKACKQTQNLSSAPRERQTTEGKGQNPEAAATWRDSGVQTKKAVIGEMEAPAVADQNESYALINASRQSDVESPSRDSDVVEKEPSRDSYVVKTLKLTAVVFGAFLVTNVPYMVQEVILALGQPGILDANLVALFGVISASNSAINPYIFLYFEKRQLRDSHGFVGSILKGLPCFGRRGASRPRGGSQQMVNLTVNYSSRHSRTVTTANYDSASCSEKNLSR
ncbi:hypothetical protein MTO96_019228 [Rhipicephalus appendiculatus]